MAVFYGKGHFLKALKVTHKADDSMRDIALPARDMRWGQNSSALGHTHSCYCRRFDKGKETLPAHRYSFDGLLWTSIFLSPSLSGSGCNDTVLFMEPLGSGELLKELTSFNVNTSYLSCGH